MGANERMKADFHCHTSDDPRDRIAHSAEMLIDALARKGFDVLALACHGRQVCNDYLSEFARRRGVLLVPALEAEIEGKHVLILNPDDAQTRAKTFAELRNLGRRDAAIVAPHPYFPLKTALGRKLEENIDLFDAIEYSSFYLRALNFNRPAQRCAARHDLPMIGNSDCHALPYEDSTFTWVDAEPSVDSVIHAIRTGRVTVQSRPRPLKYVAQMLTFSIIETGRDLSRWRAGSEDSA